MSTRTLAMAILGGWGAVLRDLPSGFPSGFELAQTGHGSPCSTRNGGTRTGAAKAKREKRRRRNIAKRVGGAA